MRYAVVAASAQVVSYAVFAALVVTVLAAAPQLAVIIGAACGALVSYSGQEAVRLPADSRRPSAATTLPGESGTLSIACRCPNRRCRNIRDRRGPAGLTAAYCLTKEKRSVVDHRARPDLCRWRHQPHRSHTRTSCSTSAATGFFSSKSKEVVALWQEISPDDFIARPRAVADLLQRQILLLSAEGVRGAAQARR